MPERNPRLKNTKAFRLCMAISIPEKSLTVKGASYRSISFVTTKECSLQMQNLLNNKLCDSLSSVMKSPGSNGAMKGSNETFFFFVLLPALLSLREGLFAKLVIKRTSKSTPAECMTSEPDSINLIEGLSLN